MQRTAIHLLLSVVASGACALWSFAAHAEDVLESHIVSDSTVVARLIEQPIPANFCIEFDTRSATARGTSRLTDPTTFAASLDAPIIADLEQSDGALDRLISTRRLELLTLMRSKSAAVFFGLNERGRLGVHFDASQLLIPKQ